MSTPIGLLLILTQDAGGITPTASDDIVGILIADEVATGVEVRIWAEGFSNTGNTVLDSAPEITIWTLDSSGTRTVEHAASYMTSSGEAYYYDWTPSADGNYMIQVLGTIATVTYFANEPVTARPKFDPIALALHDTLVARN